MLKKCLHGRRALSFALPGLLLLLMQPSIGQAQLKDKLYLMDETTVSGVDILEVNEKKVIYRNKQGKELAYNTRHVVLAFNGQGNYLTFPITEEQLNRFFSPEERASGHDLIITLSRQVIPGVIEREDEFELNYQDIATKEAGRPLSTTEIAAIIYKNGTHKLFTSPSQASHILTALVGQVSSGRLLSYGVQETPSQTLLAGNEGPEEIAPVEMEVVEEEVNFPAQEAALPTMEIDFRAYQEKALQKTADLGTYLSIISDRRSDLVKANKAVELAMQLFVNEDAQVEVSGKTGKARYTIRKYLNRLKLLKYDRIEISWSDISYISELRKGADGNYYGIITFQQRFDGFIDGVLAYSDLTEKNVEVILKAYEKEAEGRKQEMWDVFLSDIGVVMTNFD